MEPLLSVTWAVGTTNKAKVQCVEDAVRQCFGPPLTVATSSSTSSNSANAATPLHTVDLDAIAADYFNIQNKNGAATTTSPQELHHEIVAVPVSSAVAAQPMSAEESQAGAFHRAKAALLAVPAARFGVGLEGGVEKVGDRWFECGWMCVIERATTLAAVSSNSNTTSHSGGAAAASSEKNGEKEDEDLVVGRVGWGSSARYEMSARLMHGILHEGKELSEIMDAVTGSSDVRSTLGAMGVLTAGHLARKAAYLHGMLFALAPFLSKKELFWDQ